MNFYNMESMILERRWETYTKQLRHYNSYRRNTLHLESEEDFFNSPLSKCPSNDVFAKCFLARFLVDEHLYLNEMEQLCVSNSISFDHTFKVSANIGYCREDKVWVSQYNSMFIVMNSEGKVLTWQLTKTTSFEEVRTILEDLHARFQAQKQQIKVVYVDDCCKLRSKIQSVFGQSVLVKLDLFHAVQRITRTLPKRNPRFHQCLQQLRNVFRDKGDVGERRTAHTPPPDIILQNLDVFCSTWRDAADTHGNKLFTSGKTETAVENLKKHIAAGCLSNIPPVGGTTRNEHFHQHIDSFFNKSKVGILLAYALLTVITHYHNTSKKHGKVTVRPIAASPFIGTSRTSRYIGRLTDDTIATNIRQLFVAELDGERQQEYGYFLVNPSIDYHAETLFFLQEGFLPAILVT